MATPKSSDEQLTAWDRTCMNPRAESCSVCIFDGSRWCKPEERKAKQLLDIERAKGQAA